MFSRNITVLTSRAAQSEIAGLAQSSEPISFAPNSGSRLMPITTSAPVEIIGWTRIVRDDGAVETAPLYAIDDRASDSIP